MIRKNYKKDYLNLLEELESSKLEEHLKLKLEKLKIESKMLSVLLELPLKKVLLLEVDVHCYMLQEPLIPLKARTLNKIWVLKSSKKQ